jgi:methionyl-tRNA formyltransferase
VGERLSLVVVAETSSWIVPYARDLVADLETGHDARLVADYDDIPVGADVSFFLGCTKIARADQLARSRHNIVVHQSRLPEGRGWSPLWWQVLEGADVIPVTVFEAAPGVDEGVVYFRDEIHMRGDELVDELRDLQGRNAIELCKRVVSALPDLCGAPQSGEATHYRRRSPEDSRLDPDRTIAEQFDLLRIVDNDRYPAFFELRGHRYVLTIRKADGETRS